MAKKQQPIIYTTETCVYCHALMEWFDEQEIKYTQKDLADPIIAEEISKKLGYPITTVPTTLIGDEVIVGFNRPAITKALAKNA